MAVWFPERTGVVLCALSLAVVPGCSGGPDDVVCAEETVTTEDGLAIRDLECGEGEPADRGDALEVQFTGSIRGQGVFERRDSAYRFRLGVGEVIEGWDDGLEGMQEGGVRSLTIPPDLGYGSTGLEPDIPPNATLVYEIELLSREEAE